METREEIMRPGRERGQPRGRASDDGVSGSQPRVVIFEDRSSTRVEVLELPASVTPGGSFHHGGTTWRVTGTRTRQRVLIAQPDLA